MRPILARPPKAGTTTCFLFVLIYLMAVAASARAESKPASQPRIRRTVVVSIPDRKPVVLSEGQKPRVFPVSVGAAASPSPVGSFVITSRVANPGYYHPGVVIPAGAQNPLGPRWLGLNKKGYGIHGTNAPQSVGKAASHGCVRLRNRDVVELYSMLSVGDAVEIHGERDERVVALFGAEPNATANLQSVDMNAGGQ